MPRKIRKMVDKIQAQVLLKRKAQALKANLKRRKESAAESSREAPSPPEIPVENSPKE